MGRRKPGGVPHNMSVAKHKVIKDLKKTIQAETLVIAESAIEQMEGIIEKHAITAGLVGINRPTIVGECLSQLVEQLVVNAVSAMSDVRGDLGPAWLTSTLHSVCHVLTQKSGLRHAIQLAIEKPPEQPKKAGPDLILPPGARD